MLAIFFAFVALIIYGSLYPWNFHVPVHLTNPVEALLHSASLRGGLQRRFIADILINLALYLPVGMSGYLAFRRLRPAALRMAGPVVFGFFLSASIEMAQLFVPGRRCSLLDLLDNTLGSALGVLAGAFFEQVVGRRWTDGRTRREVARPALALLLIWLGSLVFPLFPVMWLGVFHQKLAMLANAPVLDVVAFVSAVGSWYAAGTMLRNVVSGQRLLWMSVALLPAQFFIMTRLPSFAEICGAIAGVLLFEWRPREPAAWPFLALLLFRGLVPFHFGPAHGYSLVPFHGFLDMEWQAGIRVMLEKTWYFGAAIWLLRTEGTPLERAIPLVTGVAALLEVGQVFLPGRTAEATDPILAVMMGLAIYALRKPHPASAGRGREW